MFELFFVGGLLALVVPLAVLGGIAYMFFWLVSAVFETTGAVIGVVVGVVFCVLAVVAVILFGIMCLPFLIFA